jgi:hypothetical protein
MLFSLAILIIFSATTPMPLAFITGAESVASYLSAAAFCMV